jgi:cyclohexyl-isocyanide hydratase
MNRREFGKISTAAAIASILSLNKSLNAQNVVLKNDAQKQHDEETAKYKDLMSGKKLTIAMVAYPGMFLQDLVGPLTVFEALMNRTIHLVWKDKNPIDASSLIKITPTTTFAECPKDLDVLFFPGGGSGTLNLMRDKETLDFLIEKSKTTKYITSVCTGSLILGAAGLLKGYKATSHWATLDVLKEFGAIPTAQRIVEDRNRITGGGVTAGIDFGLTLAAKLRSRTYAEAVQLYIEYNPQPPFNAGSPKTASAEANKFISEMLAPLSEQASRIAKEMKRRK